MASAPVVTENHRGLRIVALGAVILGVLALVAAAFLLSYSGIHAIARAAGVSPSLARLYPLILDAMLVIACAAVLSLRGAGLVARFYAWLSMLVLLAAAAGADAVNATGTRLPHRPTAAAAAIIPWALVLIGFGLLLTMLRHARQRMLAAPRLAAVPPPRQGQDRLGINELLTPREPAQNTPSGRPGPDPARQAPATVTAPATMAPAAAADPALAAAAGLAANPATTASPATTNPAAARLAPTARSDKPASATLGAASPAASPANTPSSLAATPATPVSTPATGSAASPAGAASTKAAIPRITSASTAASSSVASSSAASSADTASPGTPVSPGKLASPALAAEPSDIADTWPGTGRADHGAEQGPDLVIDTDPGQDDPTSDEAHAASQPGTGWVRQESRDEMLAESDVAYAGGYLPELSPAPTADFAPVADLGEAVPGKAVPGKAVPGEAVPGDAADRASGRQFSEADQPTRAAQPASDMAGGPTARQAHGAADELAGQRPKDGADQAASHPADDGHSADDGHPCDYSVGDRLISASSGVAAAGSGQVAGVGAEGRGADHGASAQPALATPPAPAPLPQFLRKWGPPTPPEEEDDQAEED